MKFSRLSSKCFTSSRMHLLALLLSFVVFSMLTSSEARVVPQLQGSAEMWRPESFQKGAFRIPRGGATSRSSKKLARKPTPTTKKFPIKLMIRILFLCYYGSLGSLMPYLPVYYDSLGHGGQIIGLLGAVKPATTFVIAPVWGFLADQLQKPFLILQVTFVVSLLGQLLMPFRDDAKYIMTCVFVTALFNAPVKSLLDSMVLDHIPDKADYGRMRLWGQMGFGIGSSVVGMLLSKSNPHEAAKNVIRFDEWLETTTRFWNHEPIRGSLRALNQVWQSLHGYKLLFFCYACLSLPTWLFIQAFRRMDMVQAKDAENRASKVGLHRKVLRAIQKRIPQPKTASSSANNALRTFYLLLRQNGDVTFFFFLVLVIGISSGAIENFAYVRLREVGGTGKEMGLSRLVSSLAGAPMFWFSGRLNQVLGVDRILVLALLSYVTRFVIYASMTNPYHGLPAEALRGLTFAAFWSSGTIYAHRVSPPGVHATMLLCLNAMYGGLGQSLGAIIGGKVQHAIGTVGLFWYGAAVDLGMIGLILIYLSFQTNSSYRNPRPILPREPSKEP